MDISKLKTINGNCSNVFIYSAFGLSILSILIHYIYKNTQRSRRLCDDLYPLLVSFTCGLFPYLVVRYIRSPLVLYGDSIERFGKVYKWEDVSLSPFIMYVHFFIGLSKTSWKTAFYSIEYLKGRECFHAQNTAWILSEK